MVEACIGTGPGSRPRRPQGCGVGSGRGHPDQSMAKDIDLPLAYFLAATVGPRSASRSHSPSPSPTHPLPAGDRRSAPVAPPAAWCPGHPARKTIKRKPGAGTPTPLINMWGLDKIKNFDLYTMAYQDWPTWISYRQGGPNGPGRSVITPQEAYHAFLEHV